MQPWQFILIYLAGLYIKLITALCILYEIADHILERGLHVHHKRDNHRGNHAGQTLNDALTNIKTAVNLYVEKPPDTKEFLINTGIMGIVNIKMP